jgi:hypothetical protein
LAHNFILASLGGAKGGADGCPNKKCGKILDAWMGSSPEVYDEDSKYKKPTDKVLHDWNYLHDMLKGSGFYFDGGETGLGWVPKTPPGPWPPDDDPKHPDDYTVPEPDLRWTPK